MYLFYITSAPTAIPTQYPSTPSPTHEDVSGFFETFGFLQAGIVMAASFSLLCCSGVCIYRLTREKKIDLKVNASVNDEDAETGENNPNLIHYISPTLKLKPPPQAGIQNGEDKHG